MLPSIFSPKIYSHTCHYVWCVYIYIYSHTPTKAPPAVPFQIIRTRKALRQKSEPGRTFFNTREMMPSCHSRTKVRMPSQNLSLAWQTFGPAANEAFQRVRLVRNTKRILCLSMSRVCFDRVSELRSKLCHGGPSTLSTQYSHMNLQPLEMRKSQPRMCIASLESSCDRQRPSAPRTLQKGLVLYQPSLTLPCLFAAHLNHLDPSQHHSFHPARIQI